MNTVASLRTFLLFIFLFQNTISQYSSESFYLTTKTSWAIGEGVPLYVYLTNRPYNVTHGNTTYNPPNTVPNQQLPLIGPTGDIWKKAFFLPKVDKLTLFTLGNTTGWYGIPEYQQLRVFLQALQGDDAVKTITRKPYWTNGYIVGSWSAIIEMTMGKPTNVYWDDGCQDCTLDECIDNTCAIPATACTGSLCDMKFYIGWKGTDSDGNQLTSSGELPSVFRTLSFKKGIRFMEAAAGEDQQDTNLFTIV